MSGIIWLPLTRELSSVARLRERKISVFANLNLFSPSVKTYGFATSLVRGRRNPI